MNALPKVGAVPELCMIIFVTPNLALVTSAVIFPVSGIVKVPYTLSVEKDITVPVVDGDSIDNFKFNAVWVAVDIGLFKSEVLSTFPKPISAFVVLWGLPVLHFWIEVDFLCI